MCRSAHCGLGLDHRSWSLQHSMCMRGGPRPSQLVSPESSIICACEVVDLHHCHQRSTPARWSAEVVLAACRVGIVIHITFTDHFHPILQAVNTMRGPTTFCVRYEDLSNIFAWEVMYLFNIAYCYMCCSQGLCSYASCDASYTSTEV